MNAPIAAKSSACKHHQFDANAKVFNLEDTAQFMVELTVTCRQCSLPFRFLGLPIGVHMAGATTNVDGLEVRLAIAPSDRSFHPLDGVVAFGVKAS
jgi:hypothetical protein